MSANTAEEEGKYCGRQIHSLQTEKLVYVKPFHFSRTE
jgi:hypothetical protein